MERINQHQETIKHAVDAVAIPGGVAVGLASYMELINGVLTSFVLIASLIWTIVRIVDMRNTQRRKKRDPETKK